MTDNYTEDEMQEAAQYILKELLSIELNPIGTPDEHALLVEGSITDEFTLLSHRGYNSHVLKQVTQDNNGTEHINVNRLNDRDINTIAAACIRYGMIERIEYRRDTLERAKRLGYESLEAYEKAYNDDALGDLDDHPF